MQLFCALVCVVAAVVGQEMHYVQPQGTDLIYPVWYIQSPLHHQQRHRRDLSVDPKTGDVTGTHKVGNGDLFGKLGSTGSALYGKGGYQAHVYDGERGKVDVRGYGTRVLSAGGSATGYGGGATWKGDHAAASLDVNRMRGMTSVHSDAGGRWEVSKNGDLSLKGTYDQILGRRPDYGVMGNFNYRF